MLSRHADGLFWLGRYIERASDVVRILDVAYNAQLERSARSAGDLWRDVLRVLYREGDFAGRYGEAFTTDNVNHFLVFDQSEPASIATSVREARTNVMNVRDAVPNELLESVNALHTKLRSGVLDEGLSPHEIYQALAVDCRQISGAINEAMAREDEYRFLMIGRYLERAEMTCRLIEVNASVSRSDAATWMGVLRSLSGFHAFLRTHGPLAPADDVVEFLLHSESFPFSVLHCLRAAAAHTSAVAEAGTWRAPRVLGRVAATLEFADIPPVQSGMLDDLIDDIAAGIREVSKALHDDLYRSGGEPWLFSFEAL